jgi:2-dehydro-3-deoxy-D-arabinonate dehydratase
MIKLYKAPEGLVAALPNGSTVGIPLTLDELFEAENPLAVALAAAAKGKPAQVPQSPGAPIQSQEVWAAGVTYFRSRDARMEESKASGGGTFYDKVYSADRPELFFKSTPHRVAGPGEPVRIRGDSKWNVPEPELTLAINSRGRIFGYTIGNDMSSRDIEGENPLYLPQAKVYDKSAAIGPCLFLSDSALPSGTEISISIVRDGSPAFSGSTAISQIKRTLPSLAEFLFRDNSFPHGCFLMTGTGIVPGDDFTLRSGDGISITIPAIGTLTNPVA